jgi:oxalate---CoA ligase
VTEGELRAYLFQHVAESKVPSRIVFVDAIPKGPTGKPQRGGLAGALERQLSVPYAAPETPTEKTLAGIWGEVLHVDAIGRDDNFFALGGDSLSAMRVLNRANARFGVSLGVRQVFDFPTLKEQAARLAELVRGAGRPDGP